jgi:hypothetical protein
VLGGLARNLMAGGVKAPLLVVHVPQENASQQTQGRIMSVFSPRKGLREIEVVESKDVGDQTGTVTN